MQSLCFLYIGCHFQIKPQLNHTQMKAYSRKKSKKCSLLLLLKKMGLFLKLWLVCDGRSKCFRCDMVCFAKFNKESPGGMRLNFRERSQLCLKWLYSSSLIEWDCIGRCSMTVLGLSKEKLWHPV